MGFRNPIIAALVACVGACGLIEGDGGGPDGRPHNGDVFDGSVGGDADLAGIVLRLTGRPELPGSLGGDFEAQVTRVEITFRDLRIIGDAAPGDDRTSREQLLFDWEEANPLTTVFSAAPPGLYSRVVAELHEYDIRGTCVVDSQEFAFKIEEEVPGGLSVDLELGQRTLEPLGTLTIDVGIDVGSVVSEVRWDGDGVEIEEDGTRLELEGDSEALQAVRQRLLEGIQVHD